MVRNRQTVFLIFALILFGLFPLHGLSLEQPKYTGTFSSLKYNSESGDLGGVEIRIVYAKTGYQAALQFSEGAPTDLIIVNPSFDGTSVYFEIPETNDYAGSFSGTIDNKSLKGTFRFKTGGEWKVNLPRKPSYWD